MKVERPSKKAVFLLTGAFSVVALFLLACGSSSSSSSSNTSFNSVYRDVKWGSTIAVSFPSDCTMTITATGELNYTPNPYYLVPVSSQHPATVAYTAVTHTALALAAFPPGPLSGSSATVNTCPVKAAATTTTNPGIIGYLISGSALFNPYEASQTVPALSDNASYTFVDGSGASQTAYFIDQCNSHSNGTFHAHGNPNCVTSQVDTATGPSHIIGVALDGFPVYGGRDIDGNVIAVSQLDSCNGITSATPEFPDGVYHYVLPLGVTSNQSSMRCYAGSVAEPLMAVAATAACRMPRRKV